MTSKPKSKRDPIRDDGRRERLRWLLSALGNSDITVDEFWRRMREVGLNNDDIDQHCVKEAEEWPNKQLEAAKRLAASRPPIPDTDYGLGKYFVNNQGIGLSELTKDFPNATKNPKIMRGFLDAWRRKGLDLFEIWRRKGLGPDWR